MPQAAAAPPGAEDLGLREPGPRWASVPDPEMLADAYPPKAAEDGVEGKAMIGCKVTAEGRLRECTLVSEEPAGHGFGQAAVSLAPKFLMSPSLYTVEERTVRIPIVFKLPPEEPAAQAPLPDVSGGAWALLALVGVLLLALFAWTRRHAGPASAAAAPRPLGHVGGAPPAPPALPAIVSEARRNWLRPWRAGR